MSEIIIKVQMPELVGAVLSLAAAIHGGRTVAPEQSAPVPTTPPAAPAPATPPISAAAPVAQPASSAPVAPAPVQPPAAPPVVPVVPVAAAPTYTREQIMTAGAALIDTGKINELMGLLSAFGVQAVTQLRQDQLGAFATELRKLGAKI